MSPHVRDFVTPFYMQFLHGNFLHGPGPRQDAEFLEAATAALHCITDADLEPLLRGGGWRELLSASWFIGLRKLDYYVDWLGDLLLQSSTCFAGQGYCFAMARFCTEESARYLCQYLDAYLPVRDRQYDQRWAIGALAWIDGERASNLAAPYVANGEAWDVTAGQNVIGNFEPREAVQDFRRVMEFCNKNFGR